MQLDVMKIRIFIEMGAQVLWSGIHQMLGCIILLYFLIGPSTFVGLGMMVVSIPLQGYLQVKLCSILTSFDVDHYCEYI